MICWAKSKCEEKSIHPSRENLRKVLGDAVSLVRFPLMELSTFSESDGNFVNGTIKTILVISILKEDELAAMVQYFGKKNYATVFD